MRTLTLGGVILFALAGGCEFAVRGLPAATPPGGGDFAVPGGDDADAPPDLGGADLAQPPDLLPCTQIVQPFTKDVTGWTLRGTAKPDLPNLRLQLTAPVSGEAGAAFYSAPVMVPALDATFQIYIGEGSGADGLALVLARAELTPEVVGNGQSGEAHKLGYMGIEGLAIEFDTFDNFGNGDADDNHVALTRAPDGQHLVTGSPPMLDCDCTRTVRVRLTPDRISVTIDGSPVIDSVLTAGVFTPGAYFLGFTAASGGSTNRHGVSNVTFNVGPPGVCF